MKHLKLFENFLNEYRFQMEIPFDNKLSIHNKPVHVHIKDALKEMKTKTKPENYKSYIKNIDSILNKEAFDEAKHDFLYDEDNDNNYYIVEFLHDNNFDDVDYKNYYNEKFFKIAEEDFNGDFYDLADNLFSYEARFTEFRDYLTKEGIEAFNKFLEDKFENLIDDFIYNIKVDDDGLINVYRAMTIGKGASKDAFENMIKHNRVGIYWSWDESAAEAHSGSWGDDYKLFYFYGKVKPENVNWKITLYKNVYSLSDEREIQIEEFEEVLLYDIKNEDGKSINIEPVVVEA